MNQKLAVCVKSCHEHREAGYHEIIRGTWGKDAKALGIEVKFFIGAIENKHYKLESDEIALKCPDDYQSLPYKTRRICEWAGSKILTHVFLCDTDTFLVPRLMLTSGYQGFDYAGRFGGNISEPFKYHATDRTGQTQHFDKCYPWASGGYGYFLSLNATREVAYEYPMTWAEDLWVGQVLGPLAAEGAITILDTAEQKYSDHYPSAFFKHGYDPKDKWMETQYANRK